MSSEGAAMTEVGSEIALLRHFLQEWGKPVPQTVTSERKRPADVNTIQRVQDVRQKLLEAAESTGYQLQNRGSNTDGARTYTTYHDCMAGTCTHIHRSAPCSPAAKEPSPLPTSKTSINTHKMTHTSPLVRKPRRHRVPGRIPWTHRVVRQGGTVWSRGSVRCGAMLVPSSFANAMPHPVQSTHPTTTAIARSNSNLYRLLKQRQQFGGEWMGKYAGPLPARESRCACTFSSNAGANNHRLEALMQWMVFDRLPVGSKEDVETPVEGTAGTKISSSSAPSHVGSTLRAYRFMGRAILDLEFGKQVNLNSNTMFVILSSQDRVDNEHGYVMSTKDVVKTNKPRRSHVGTLFEPSPDVFMATGLTMHKLEGLKGPLTDVQFALRRPVLLSGGMRGSLWAHDFTGQLLCRHSVAPDPQIPRSRRTRVIRVVLPHPSAHWNSVEDMQVLYGVRKRKPVKRPPRKGSYTRRGPGRPPNYMRTRTTPQDNREPWLRQGPSAAVANKPSVLMACLVQSSSEVFVCAFGERSTDVASSQQQSNKRRKLADDSKFCFQELGSVAVNSNDAHCVAVDATFCAADGTKLAVGYDWSECGTTRGRVGMYGCAPWGVVEVQEGVWSVPSQSSLVQVLTPPTPHSPLSMQYTVVSGKQIYTADMRDSHSREMTRIWELGGHTGDHGSSIENCLYSPCGTMISFSTNEHFLAVCDIRMPTSYVIGEHIDKHRRSNQRSVDKSRYFDTNQLMRLKPELTSRYCLYEGFDLFRGMRTRTTAYGTSQSSLYWCPPTTQSAMFSPVLRPFIMLPPVAKHESLEHREVATVSAEFSADSRFLYTTSLQDGYMRVYDLMAGTCGGDGIQYGDGWTVSLAEDPNAKICQVSSGSGASVVNGCGGRMGTEAFSVSVDRSLIVSGTVQGHLYLHEMSQQAWEPEIVASWTAPTVPSSHTDHTPYVVDYSTGFDAEREKMRTQRALDTRGGGFNYTPFDEMVQRREDSSHIVAKIEVQEAVTGDLSIFDDSSSESGRDSAEEDVTDSDGQNSEHADDTSSSEESDFSDWSCDGESAPECPLFDPMAGVNDDSRQHAPRKDMRSATNASSVVSRSIPRKNVPRKNVSLRSIPSKNIPPKRVPPKRVPPKSHGKSSDMSRNSHGNSSGISRNGVLAATTRPAVSPGVYEESDSSVSSPILVENTEESTASESVSEFDPDASNDETALTASDSVSSSSPDVLGSSGSDDGTVTDNEDLELVGMADDSSSGREEQLSEFEGDEVATGDSTEVSLDATDVSD